MEWGKAKTILILAFLGLNLVLGYQLWVIKQDVLGSKLYQAEITQETQRILESKGITVEGEIPEETPNAGEITVRFTNASSILDKPDSPQIELETPVLFVKLQQELPDQIPFADQYEVDPIQSSEGHYVMNQLYNGLPMFEVNLELFHEQGEITAYKQRYVEVIPNDTVKDQSVLSAYIALQLLTENYLQSGSTIQDIRLGFHGKIYDSVTQVLAPKWRFALADGSIYYLHAINGEVEEVQKE